MQTFLGFCTSIRYCASCDIKYNKANPKDVSFHRKIHKRPKIPRSMQICEHFYNKQGRYYYGEQYINACCDGFISQKTYIMTHLHYETIEARDALLSKLKIVYRQVEYKLPK